MSQAWSHPVARPPMPKGPTKYPGPIHGFGLTKAARLTSGPGDPPAGFLNGNNSRDEWPPYWALTKICPRMGLTFMYQSKVQGGRKRPGGSVPDFLIIELRMILRIQTERYHIAVGSGKQLRDTAQRRSLENAGFVVIDLYAQDYNKDKSGQAIIKLVWDALHFREMPNPILTRRSLARL